MGKKLAIIGHPTRGNEVIKLLEMLGGKNCYNLSGLFTDYGYYFIGGPHNVGICGVEYIFSNEDICLFTLEEFFEKYPFKVGDKVQVLKSGKVFTIGNMIWDDEVCNIYYYNTDDIEYYNAEELKLYKETDTVKPVTNKSERTHEDVIFDSIIWHLRNSINNGKQTISGGECEDYFREVVKKNNENKMSDCKKCGLGFGSVQCFDKDCPHNTPKSYAVSLVGDKVIDNLTYKDIDMNTCKDTAREAHNKIAYLSINNENYADQIEIDLGDNYEYKFEMNRLYILKKKPKYPKTYKECCDVLGIDTMDNDAKGYKHFLVIQFQELLIARDAYWKMAGEQMGLGKSWEPDWNWCEYKFCIGTIYDEIERFHAGSQNCMLAFPTEEMRDAFYENFKDLIERCKEFL